MQNLLAQLAVPASWLALPALLIWAYDKWIAARERPKNEKGESAPAPLYVRIAEWVLLVGIAAVVMRVGVSVVFGWLREVAVPLSWFAAPIGVWCALDSWLLAPRRQAAAGPVVAPDPPLVRAAYAVLPVLVVAVIVRMLSAESLDFSLVLLALSVATGIVWGVDYLFFRKRRGATLPEPGTVDYARSFFPVAFIVLLVRSFIFEPFRIPSDSMMPTLLDGDFIVVNKFAYGLRWPVLNEKFLDTGMPKRGDVVVFRYPPDPNVNYIKRLVGLPGDRIEVRNDHLVVNGETIALEEQGRFSDGCYFNMRLATETLGEHTHQVLSCRTPGPMAPARDLLERGGVQAMPVCDRKKIRESYSGGYLCNEAGSEGLPDANDYALPGVVPAGQYLMIGDNRDNSADSRVWHFVPDKNLVGKATRIWFNFDLQRSGVINWRRIGDSID